MEGICVYIVHVYFHYLSAHSEDFVSADFGSRFARIQVSSKRSILRSDQCIHGETNAAVVYLMVLTFSTSPILAFVSFQPSLITFLPLHNSPNSTHPRVTSSLPDSWNISNPSPVACPRSSPFAKGARLLRAANQTRDNV